MINLISLHKMTAKEVVAFEHLAKSATLMLKLPKLHPMERAETCNAFHILQNKLLARPGLRALGWGK
jgi:hypothetical protein